MQKGSVLPIILGILIIGGVVSGYLYFNFNQSTPSPKIKPVEQKDTVKTYSNEKLGFGFQYDKDLKVQEDSEEEFNERGNGNFRKNFTYYVTYTPAEVLGVVVVLDETNSFDTNPLTIWVFENLDNLTVEKWYKDYWYYPFVWGDYTERRNNVAPINEATISGQIAKYGVVNYQPSQPKFIYLSKDKKMFLFRIIREKGDQIISTFKFL